MKASTLFVISIALLIGLGAAAGARYIGLFEKKAPLIDPAIKAEQILVLVAVSDLPPNVAITANDVRVRELYPNERTLYEQNRGSFFPAFVSAAHLRVPREKILADQPLLRKFFKEEQAEPVTKRLGEGMRAVTVRVPKERCAGGVIQLGEYVDVMLSTKINDLANPARQFVRTAVISRENRIVLKRDSLQTVMAADPDGGNISFTLEANPYRAALIEFAQHQGQLTLVPNPTPKSEPLRATPSTESTGMVRSFSDMNSREYRDEDKRVEEMNQGVYAVGDEDLVRLFRIEPPVPKIPPIEVIRVRGITPVDKMSFPRDPQSNAGDTMPQVVPYGNQQPFGQAFSNPNAGKNPGDPGYCASCEDNKKKSANQGLAMPVTGGLSASFSSPR